jgi:hypothetical protein
VVRLRQSSRRFRGRWDGAAIGWPAANPRASGKAFGAQARGSLQDDRWTPRRRTNLAQIFRPAPAFALLRGTKHCSCLDAAGSESVNTDAIGTNRCERSRAATSRDASRASPKDAKRRDTSALPTRSRRRARRRHRLRAAGVRTNYDHRDRTNRHLRAEQIRCRAPEQERRKCFSSLANAGYPFLFRTRSEVLVRSVGGNRFHHNFAILPRFSHNISLEHFG